MKFFKSKYILSTACMAAAMALTGCNDYLDVTPPSTVTPEKYFTTAEQLGYYTINYYCGYGNWGASDDSHGGEFPSHADYTSFIHDDMGTDNESASSPNGIFFEGTGYQVGQSGGKWNFNRINDINFFLNTVLPKYEANEIDGNPTAVKHYIGEGYFLRAQEYFFRLRSLGDFPIIKENFPDDREVLIAASKRAPRNKVARFILEDLDKAIEFLSDGSAVGGGARITRDAALLFKARVALYEATWEKYFSGTPFVPEAQSGWPGATMSYNADFTYDNQTEVNFFLDQALDAAKQVADARQLTNNNKQEIGLTNAVGANPYYDMFATTDPSNYQEVIMYRVYNREKAGGHSLNQYMRSGQPRGYTQEFANAFLMQNGLPIYAQNSGYAGDDFVADTKVNRDWRWKLFMKAPGEYPYADAADQMGLGKSGKVVPDIRGGSYKYVTSTGYKKGKYMAKETKYTSTSTDETASVIFRAAEAYLIYIEAAWERYGDGLNSDAWKYWKALRQRAGVDDDIQKTIAATDLDQEEYYTHDLGLYSAGKRIDSKVLYNIRRERRCELMSEGFRLDDLFRWRSLDQLKGKKFFLHGVKVFGPMKDEYTTRQIKYDQAKDDDNNVSSPSDVEGGLNGDPRYLSLFRINKNNEYYNSGMTWHMAHYLSPIAVDHFQQSSSDGVDVTTSPIYQNPYWLIQTSSSAVE